MSDLLSAALRHADRGWPVFPVMIAKLPDGKFRKTPLTQHGHKDASTDPAAIEAMPWSRANGIGLATEPPRLLVLDVDPGGEEALGQLERRHGALPLTYTVRTPRGGRHLYFSRLSPVQCSAGRLGKGLDVRADGGYVVVPPSEGYALATDEEMAAAPGWLVDLAKAKESTPSSQATVGSAILDGTRNATLASMAGAMRRRGMTEAAIAAALKAENESRCKPPLPSAEVESIARSVARYQPAAPISPGDVLLPKQGPTTNDLRPQPLKELHAEAQRLAKMPITQLGLPGLDEGVREGYTVVLGAFTGTGKTSTALMMARELATRGHPLLFVTAELSPAEVAMRLGEADLPGFYVMAADREFREVLAAAKAWIAGLPKESPHPVFVLDYLQRCRAPEQSSREREVAWVCEELQTFGRATGAVVIAAAQLNRKATETVPKLEHLRESGLLEQVADLALLLSRPEPDTLMVTVAKARWGRSQYSIALRMDWANLLAVPIDPPALAPAPQRTTRPSTRDAVRDAAGSILRDTGAIATFETIASKVGISPRTAKEHVAVLESAGELVVDQGGGRSRPSRIYRPSDRELAERASVTEEAVAQKP